MTNYLINRFIHDKDNVTDTKVREAYGKMSGIIGIITNCLLSVIKVAVGLVFNSIAIIADGINNISDAGSSIITLIGFKLAGMPEDKDHPYGHARYEYIAGLVVSFIILLLGAQLLKSSIQKIINPEPVKFSVITAVLLVIAILIKLWQMLFYAKIAKIINSTTIMAVSKDSRNDILSTTVVLIGLIVSNAIDFQLDGILGLFVALFIIISGIQIIRETINPLLGQAPNPKIIHEIKSCITSYDGVLGIHDLVVHEYGPGKVFASVHVEVDSKVDVMQSHDLIDSIERDVNDKLGIHFVIHMDPVVLNNPVIDKYKSCIKKIINDIDPVLKFHDFRCVPGPTHTNLIFDVVAPIKYSMTDEEISKQIEAKVKEIDNTLFTVITVDKDFAYD